MARHTADSDAAAQLTIASLLGAGIILAIIGLVLIALVSELWRVFKSHAFTIGPARRLLWATLAVFLGLLLVAGLLTSSPATAGYSLPLICWSFFVFVIVVECIDHAYRPKEVPVPSRLTLADVATWQTAAPAVAQATPAARKAA